MRIISGIAKGRRLLSPKGSHIRPASDKVKQAIFNILGSVDDTSVLDLFAGTGSVGLEAASRGASHVVFVDFRIEAIKLIKKNSALCGLADQVAIVRGKIPTILFRMGKKWGPFAIVFIDPPYDKGLISPTLSALLSNKLIDGQSKIIIEHSPRELPECGGFRITDTRKYGQTLVSFLWTKE